jgi:hypothetical protein
MNDTLYYHWLIEGHLRLAVIKGNLTAATLTAYDQETLRMMDMLSSPMHVIVDARDLLSYPSLSDCLNVQHLRHRQMGCVLTIGVNHNRIMRFVLNAIGQATRVRCQDFDTLDAALFFLEQNDLLLNTPLVHES